MKKVLFLWLAVLLMLPSVMRAQSTTYVTIGDSSAQSGLIPFQHCYENSYCQMVYPASTLNFAGSITSIAFKSAFIGSQNFSSMRIYMGTTTSATAATSFLPDAQLTQVFSATNVAAGTSLGWETYQLTTSFAYDGISDLVIVVAKDQSSYNCNVEFYGFATSAPSSIIYYEDGNTSASLNPGGSNYEEASSFLPTLKLGVNLSALSCMYPSNVVASNVDLSSAEISWTPQGTESSWDIYLATSNTDIPDATTTPTFTCSTPFYTLQGLNSATAYKAYVRANCGSGEYSTWNSTSFRTSQIPAQLPYFCNFEDPTESSQWSIEGSGVNQWVLGTAVNATDNEAYALYVSCDSGATNNYINNSNSLSWAYRDIDFGTYVEYNLSFDVRINGESQSYDYLKVYLGPPAALPTSAGISGALPVGATLLGTFSKLNDWTRVSGVVNSEYQGIQRLYLLWWNDGSGGSSPAAAVDNLSIVGTNCGRPFNLAVDSGAVTQTSIEFHFTPALATDNAWEAIILAPGDTIDETQAVILSDTTHTFTGLTADTPYRIYVRTNCGTEYSNWSEVLNIRTECPQYMSIPYAEGFDTYGTGSNSYFPSCWTRRYTSASAYPYCSSTTPASGAGCLYFYSSASSSYYSCAIAPEIDTITNPLNSLTVSFKIKKTNTTAGYGALEVGVMTDPNDMSTFTLVQAFTGAEWTSGQWHEVEIQLTDYVGYGAYIALRKASTSTYYTYIDDFEVYTTPSCLRPLEVEVTSVTDNSVSVSWLARNNETAWLVAVVPAGSDVTLATPETVYENPYTIYNLTDNTEYDVYVKADCGGGDESNWSSPVTFWTRCLPTNVIPFTESFEGLGSGAAAYPNCWDRMTNNTSTSYPYVSTTYASDGAASLYFYSTTTLYSLAVSQALDLSTFTANSLHLTFKARKTSAAYGRLDVGIMTDPTNLNTLTVLKSIYPDNYSATNTWYDFDIPLTEAYENGNVYLAFLAPTGATNNVYLDEVTLDYQPECSAPTNLVISNVAGTSAFVSWEAALYGAVDYMVEYSEAGMDNWTVAEYAIANTSCFISGLNPQTQYNVRVSTNCASGETQSISATFMTGCLAGGDIVIGNGTTTNSYVPSYTFYNYSFSQQLYTAAEMGGSNTLTGMKFYISTPTSQTRNWDIYLGNVTATSLTGYTSVATHTKVFSGNVSMGTEGWLEITFDSSFAYTGGSLVVTVDDNTGSYSSATSFQGHSGTSYSAYRDGTDYNPLSPGTLTSRSFRNNVIFMGDCDSTATCIAPNVMVSDVSSQSITLSWAPGYQESSWEMEYKSATDATWTSNGSVSSSPYTLDNLTTNTVYQIRLRSECGGEYSEWVIVDVQTECEAISTLPYLQNFDAATASGAGNFIDCWFKGTNSSTSYPYTSSTQSYSPNYSMYIYGNSSTYSYAATPRISEDIDINTLQVSFQARIATANYLVEVGVMSDPNDYSTFEVVGSFTPTTINTWEIADINFDNYTGTGRYIAFRAPQWMTSIVYIDNVDIHLIPVCDRVDDITASQITTTSATISWTPRGTETSWEVLYAPAGTIDYENMVPELVSGTPSVVISNLNPSTPYDVAVRAICDNGEYGAWNWGSFRTECGTISALPYTENFETFSTGSSNPVFCWTRNSTYSASYPYVSATYAVSGGKSLYFYSASSNYSAIAMPQLDATIPTNSVEVLFQMRSGHLNNKMIVGVMTNPADISTFVGIDTVAVSVTNAFEWFNVSLASYTGTGTYIAFKNHNVSTSSYSIYMDDVELQALPTCARPYDLEAISTPNDTVQLSWTDTVGSMWDIIYGPTGFDPETSTEATLISGITTTTYDVQGLSIGVIYDFYVRSDCGGDVSPWCYIPAQGAPYTYNMTLATDTITACGITIADDGGINGNYSNSKNCVLVIYPTSEDSLLTISGTFVGESSTDYLSIYEGVGVNDERLLQKVVSGTSGTLIHFGPYTSEYGPITLKFYSSASTNFDGFAAAINCVEAPSCRRVVDMSTDAVTSNTADISWTALGENQVGYTLAVSTQAQFTPDTCTMTFTSTTNTTQLTGLNMNTTYYIMIQSDCGSGDVSTWSDVFSTTTAGNTAQVPYNSDFTSTTEVSDWIIYNGTQTNKWYLGTPTGATNPVLFVSNDGLSNSYSATSTSNVWACRDIDFGYFAEYEISFKWSAQGESCCDYINLYIGNPTVPANTNAAPIAGAVKLTTSNLNQNTSGTYFRATLDASYANTVKRLYFLWHNDGSIGTNPAGLIDSISIAGITCGRPYNLHTNNITQTTADIAFTPALPTDMAWEYVYGPIGSDPATLTPNALTDTLIQLTGLNHSTGYVVYARTACDGGEYSEWSNMFTFYTLCTSIATLPYTETFDTYGTGSSAFPLCWEKITTYSNYPYLSTTNHSAPASVYFYASSNNYNIAISPEIDTDINPMNTLEVNFWYRPSNTTSRMIVGVMSDPTDATTFVPVDTAWGTSTTWGEHTIYLSSYTGTGRYVAFKNEYTTATGYGYIDDVTIDVAPTCLPVLNLQVSNIAQTEATISWTDQTNATAWNIEYGPAGFTQGQGTIVPNVTNPYTLTGLTSATAYDVYVQAVCSATDQSEWSDAVYFATECDVINTFPYTQGYENGPSLPPCWSQEYISGTVNWNITAGTGYSLSPVASAHSGSSNASFFGGSSDGYSSYLISPIFDLTQVTDPYLSFWYAMPDWIGDQDQLVVYYRTSNTAAWTQLLSHTSDVSVWTKDSIALPNPSATYQIAFKGISYYGYGVGIDDFTIGDAVAADPCDAPTNVQVNAASNSANVSWTSSESAWVVEYKLATASNWTASPTLTTTTYNITGLTASTNYVVRVKSVCDASNESAWSAEVPFTTLAGDITTYTITATATGPGTIAPSGTVTVQEGSDITFTFTANAGAVVDRLLVDDAETAVPANNEYTFSAVVANHTIAVEFVEETGIEEIDLNAAVVLYPNPATSQIQIQVADSRFLGAEMQIFDVYGKLISNATIETLSTQVDVSQLANGMYMVRINAAEGMVTKRFVKR